MSSNNNMPTRIECGETTVNDKWIIIKIILLIALGMCLIGGGVGYMLGILW